MYKIKLKNFQSHAQSEIELKGNLITITGRSDKGKSSIVRAIKWVRDNKPAGTSFIRKGTKKAEVTIDDIVHTRTKTANSYTVDGVTFKALRGAVPEEVEAKLQLGPDNIQEQHNSMFLLQESPGKVAKKLSELVDLERPLNALKIIASEKRLLSANISAIEVAVDGHKAQIDALRVVDKADKELKVIEAEITYIAKLSEKGAWVCKAIKNAVRASKRLNTIPNTEALQPAKSVIAKHTEFNKTKEQYTKLGLALQQCKKAQSIVALNPSKLIDEWYAINEEAERIAIIKTTTDEITKTTQEVTTAKITERKLIKEKEKALKDRCPLCGRSD